MILNVVVVNGPNMIDLGLNDVNLAMSHLSRAMSFY
jgi:hypothetical protein